MKRHTFISISRIGKLHVPMEERVKLIREAHTFILERLCVGDITHLGFSYVYLAMLRVP
jgi:hypothetical protein